MLKKSIAGLLKFKPGAGTNIAGGLLLFLSIMAGGEYFNTGRVDLASMIDSGAGYRDFWVRNPNLEYADSYTRTSLFLARERSSGRMAMLDLAVVSNAEVRPQPCAEQIGAAGFLAYPGVTQAICYKLINPNQSAPPYRSAVSFAAKAKNTQIAKYYQDLFRGLGRKLTIVQDSSRAIVLEAADEEQNTVARVAIHGSSDTSYGFLAVIAAP